MTIQELFKTIYDRSPAWREWGPRTIQNVTTWKKDDFNRRGFLAEPGIHKVFPVAEDQVMVSTAKPPTDGYLQLHFYSIPVSWLELTEEQVVTKLEEIRHREYQDQLYALTEREHAEQKVAETLAAYEASLVVVQAAAKESLRAERRFDALKVTKETLANESGLTVPVELMQQIDGLLEKAQQDWQVCLNACEARNTALAKYESASNDLRFLNAIHRERPVASCLGVVVTARPPKEKEQCR